MDLGEIFGNRTNGLAGLPPRRRQPESITDLQQDVPTAAQPQTPVQVEPLAPIEEAKPVAQSTQLAVAPRKRVHRPRTTMAADRTTMAADADAAALRLVIVQLPNAIADR